ncbi:hypothetical protein Tco_0391126 [Tanacetum coccineum]
MDDTEVISMMDTNVQHEVPRTSSLLTIPVSVIPEHNVINPSETIINASATTISSLLSSLFPSLHQSTPILTRTTTEATTSTTAVPDSEPLACSPTKEKTTGERKFYKELKNDDNSFTVLKKHDADIIKELSVPVEIIEGSLSNNYLNKALRKAQKRSKKSSWSMLANNKCLSPQSPHLIHHIALYHALMESILEDEDAMDEGVAKKLKKRKPDDDDKDEGPSAGSDRRVDRQSKRVVRKLSNLERDAIFDLGVALEMFTRRMIILKRVEDLQLGVESYQKKFNITKPETFKSDISNKTPYIAYNNPQGIIYEDMYKRNRLMRTDELYKFSDGTLTSVRSVLHDIASNLRMDYLSKRRWSSLDRKRSRIMIKAIDKLLLERRLVMCLENFVGRRDYGEDLRLLQRTI